MDGPLSGPEDERPAVQLSAARTATVTIVMFPYESLFHTTVARASSRKTVPQQPTRIELKRGSTTAKHADID
jgi:hypothetical protein